MEKSIVLSSSVFFLNHKRYFIYIRSEKAEIHCIVDCVFLPKAEEIFHLFKIFMSIVITSAYLIHHHMPRTQSGAIVKIVSNWFGTDIDPLEWMYLE